MTDSEFWRDLGVKFQALQPSGVIGSYLTGSWTSGVWNQTGAQWLLSASDPQVKEEFVSLAEEAAAKYGGTTLIQNADERWKLGGEAALFFWLDVLKRESGKYKSDHGPVRNADGSDAQGERGKIMRVCEASADYCGKLARRGAAPAGSDPPLPFSEFEKDTIRMGRHTKPEIKQDAEDRFATLRDDILKEYVEQRKQVLAQVRLTGNSGGYLSALVRLEAEHVRKMIRAMAQAYAEAFTLFGVPSDRQAEEDLQTAAQQIAAGSISGIRGDLQHRSVRLRIPEEGSGVPWHLEIERAMGAALKEGVRGLRRQRIKFTDSQQMVAKRGRDRPQSKHDVELTRDQIEAKLAGKAAVKRDTAIQMLHVKERQLRNLVKIGKLTKTPAGTITTESIRSYLGLKKEIRQ
jgi:hypothetical protein